MLQCHRIQLHSPTAPRPHGPTAVAGYDLRPTTYHPWPTAYSPMAYNLRYTAYGVRPMAYRHGVQRTDAATYGPPLRAQCPQQCEMLRCIVQRSMHLDDNLAACNHGFAGYLQRQLDLLHAERLEERRHPNFSAADRLRSRVQGQPTLQSRPVSNGQRLPATASRSQL